MTEASRPARLYLMQLSTTDVPLLTGEMLPMVCVCYLVVTSDGKHILIDTGFPPDVPHPAGAPHPQNEKSVIEHLAELGLKPDDIDILICTHFDVDHVGYNDAFPQAEIVVQREQYEAARSGNLRYAAARAHWDHPALHYRLVDGDLELLPGLTLLKTSGHAPGHQSVLVRLPNTGVVLLTIDAVMFGRQFTPERPSGPNDDAEPLRASTQKLMDIAEHEQAALVVFGHDGRQWQTLKKAPDYYG